MNEKIKGYAAKLKDNSEKDKYFLSYMTGVGIGWYPVASINLAVYPKKDNLLSDLKHFKLENSVDVVTVYGNEEPGNTPKSHLPFSLVPIKPTYSYSQEWKVDWN